MILNSPSVLEACIFRFLPSAAFISTGGQIVPQLAFNLDVSNNTFPKKAVESKFDELKKN
jgi:hypothetical protein